VAPYSFLGINATIRDNISIGEACVIGAGAVILASTKAKSVYVAERTRPARRTSDEIFQ
jgi:carbonic anhydrase/acetyltransferase-like protein (isoleucine patch superfamily)